MAKNNTTKVLKTEPTKRAQREALDVLREEGLTVLGFTVNKHLKIRVSNAAGLHTTLITGQSPSDVRSLHNLRSTARNFAAQTKEMT